MLVLDAHPSVAKTDASVREPLNTLAGALERLGARVVRSVKDLPDLTAALASYGKMLMTVTSRARPDAKPIDAHAWMDALDEQARVIRRWESVFAEVDVVLTPPFGVPAFPHEDSPNWARTLADDRRRVDALRRAGRLAGCRNFPGLPATAAPIAKTKAGLPVGVQIIGGAFEDRTTLAFAALLQREGLAL